MSATDCFAATGVPGGIIRKVLPSAVPGYPRANRSGTDQTWISNVG